MKATLEHFNPQKWQILGQWEADEKPEEDEDRKREDRVEERRLARLDKDWWSPTSCILRSVDLRQQKKDSRHDSRCITFQSCKSWTLFPSTLVLAIRFYHILPIHVYLRHLLVQEQRMIRSLGGVAPHLLDRGQERLVASPWLKRWR